MREPPVTQERLDKAIQELLSDIRFIKFILAILLALEVGFFVKRFLM